MDRGPLDEPGSPPLGYLAAQDEILQVMYGLRGERLAAAVAAPELVPWVGLERPRIARLLEMLEGKGWIARVERQASWARSRMPADRTQPRRTRSAVARGWDERDEAPEA